MDRSRRELDQLLAQQAATWIDTLRNPTPAEREAFVAWLKESPRNVRDFLQMQAIDRELGNIDVGRELNVEALITAVNPRITPLRTGSVASPTGRSWRARRWLRYVAVLVLATGTGLWWATQELGVNRYRTTVAEQRTLQLEDGSVVWLNARSRLEVRFRSSTRKLRLLEGEALFRVSHDVNRPFIVETTEGTIRAVGTQFDVYERNGSTDVAVLEGQVAVSPTSSGAGVAPPSRLVLPSQSATISGGGHVWVRVEPHVEDAVSWRERRVTFRDRTLGDITAELNRYSRRRILLGDAEVAGRRYSGVFNTDDLDSFVAVLARDEGLSIESTPETVTVRQH